MSLRHQLEVGTDAKVVRNCLTNEKGGIRQYDMVRKTQNNISRYSDKKYYSAAIDVGEAAPVTCGKKLLTCANSQASR